MGLNVVDLVKYVIRPTLQSIENCVNTIKTNPPITKSVAPGFSSVSAELLLLATGAQESQFERLHQLGSGPALGIFQMEPDTHDDIWESYLLGGDHTLTNLGSHIHTRYDPDDFDYKTLEHKLIYDLSYACILARCSYYRHSFAMPLVTYSSTVSDLINTLWPVYKQYYNTVDGDATQQEFSINFSRLIVPSLGLLSKI